MASKRRKIDGQQRTLFAVGVSRPESSGESSETTSDVTPSSESKESKPRKFQIDWLTKFKWLEYDSENERMFCTLCIKFKKSNAFTKGCTNFKTSSLSDHVKSKDHMAALEAPELQNDMKKIQDVNQSAKENAVITALKSVHWLVTENIPLCKFSSFVEFQKDVGVQSLSALSVSPGISYQSDYTAHEFLDALSDTVELETRQILRDSPFVTVLCDESTDRTVTHRLVLYCQVINAVTMQPLTLYISNIKLDSGTGAGIAAAVYAEMEKRGVHSDKILGLGTDGASAMTGRDRGTTGMMLRQNPHIVNIHCIAHRLALCTSQAAESVPAMKAYQEMLTNIFYYFKYSTSRVARLTEIEKVLDHPKLKFKEVHSVRWLSFYQALEAVYRCLEPLLTYLAGANHSDAKAQGLKKKLTVWNCFA